MRWRRDSTRRTKEMFNSDKIHHSLMSVGRMSGCHQLPERSFVIRSRQFPVCARCTGVLFGNIAAVAMIFIYRPHWVWFVMGCLIMFMDWLVQYLGIRESINIRRLITGVIGGCSLASLYIMGIIYVVRMIMN